MISEYMNRYLSGWAVSPAGLLYNIPIFIVFFIVMWELLIPIKWDRKVILKISPYLAIWTFILILLYFRVVQKSIPISGHITSLTLMIGQGIMRKYPTWLMSLVIFVFFEAVYFNFWLFPSAKGGIYGLITGSALAFILFIMNHRIEKYFED
ncbi:MAG: hypothetical protein IEMM0008_0169 [bacterium]|nr:MAG: hypothetical protein IEMM0008_0169 [bacterium]